MMTFLHVCLRKMSCSAKVVLLLMVFSLNACTSRAPDGDSLYKALGERQGIDNIVHAMIYIIAQDERVKPRFKGVNIAHFKQGFSDYVCVVSGGPCEYKGESLAVVHAGHHYTNSEFNAIVEHLILAMEKQHIAVATQNQLLARLAPAYKDVVYQ